MKKAKLISLITRTFIEKAEKERERAARMNIMKQSTIAMSATVDESSTFRQSSMVNWKKFQIMEIIWKGSERIWIETKQLKYADFYAGIQDIRPIGNLWRFFNATSNGFSKRRSSCKNV